MKVAIMGYGTIGSGVEEVLRKNSRVIAERAGEPVEVKYVLDLRDFPGSPIEDRLVKDYHIIEQDPQVGIVVETMGGVEPAATFVRAMLAAGKHVTTSNKNLVAERGADLLLCAREHGVRFTFEASVGGGIPIIRPLMECLSSEVIEEVSGILNGTTNYILSKMTAEGTKFSEALLDAQQKGYAESDPTADVRGTDPCRKIAILTSLLCGRAVDYRSIYTEGIEEISAIDVSYAKSMHKTIKLLASARRQGDAYGCMVAPYLLNDSHPLASVNDVYNAVFVRGNMLGDTMFYGSGAGSYPTASAVVNDIVEMIRRPAALPYLPWTNEPAELSDYRKSRCAFFVRSSASAERIKEVFGEVTMWPAQAKGERAFITDVMTEEEFAQKKAETAVIHAIRLG